MYASPMRRIIGIAVAIFLAVGSVGCKGSSKSHSYADCSDAPKDRSRSNGKMAEAKNMIGAISASPELSMG